MDQFDIKGLGGLGKFFSFTPAEISLEDAATLVGSLKPAEPKEPELKEIAEIISFQEVYVKREIPSHNITETGDRKVVSFNKNAFSYKNNNKAIVKNIKKIAKTMTEYGCAMDSIRTDFLANKSGVANNSQAKMTNIVTTPVLFAKATKDAGTVAISNKKPKKHR